MALGSDLWIGQRNLSPHKLHIDVCDRVHSAKGGIGVSHRSHRMTSRRLYLGSMASTRLNCFREPKNIHSPYIKFQVISIQVPMP